MSETPMPVSGEPIAAEDDLPPGHPAASVGSVSAGEVLSGEGSGTGAVGSPGTQPAPAAARSTRAAGTEARGDRRGDEARLDDTDDDLDAETIAEGVRDFLEPTATSPAADADAPPPPG